MTAAHHVPPTSRGVRVHTPYAFNVLDSHRVESGATTDPLVRFDNLLDDCGQNQSQAQAQASQSISDVSQALSDSPSLDSSLRSTSTCPSPSTYTLQPNTTSNGTCTVDPHLIVVHRRHRRQNTNHSTASSLSTTPSPQRSTQLLAPVATAPTLADPQPPSPSCVHIVFHTSLIGVCEYFPFAEHLPTPSHWPQSQDRTVEGDGSTTASRAFVGQVRFKTTVEQIDQLVSYLTGAPCAYVAQHRAGCFVVHCSSQLQRDCFVRFHHAILFDINGVWIARDAQGAAALAQVLHAIRRKGPTHRHFVRQQLPGRAMVVESFTEAAPHCAMRHQKSTASAPPPALLGVTPNHAYSIY